MLSLLLFLSSISFLIEDEKIDLLGGIEIINIEPDSASKRETRYYAVNGDSDDLFVVTQNSGGSGTFYYLIIRKKRDEFDSIFIGDRIKPVRIINTGEIVLEYLCRKADQPMTAEPLFLRKAGPFTVIIPNK